MKKLFTFAIALMASMAMMAQDYATLFSTDFSDASWAGHDTICAGATIEETVNGIYFRCNNSSKQYSIADGALTFCDNNSGNNYFMAIPVQNVNDSVIVVIGTVSNSQRVNYLFRETNEISTSGVSMSSTAASINTNQSITIRYKMTGAGDEALVMLGRQGSGQKTVIKTITIYTISSTPNTDPVSSVSISGPTEAYVGQKVTLKATTDVKADTIWWTDQYGTVQASKKGVFEFTPDAEGTYTYTAWAENQYNTQPATLAHSVVVTVKALLEQALVTDHCTWDFTKAATVNQIKWEGDDKDAAPVVMANIDGFNNDANFNSQALLFSGEYPIRDGKYCQGPHLEFEINSPGLLTVVYSNTGNRSIADGETEGQEALRRFLTINGSLVPGDAGSMKSNANTTTEGIAVQPGAVVISACMPYSENPTAAQYIRIYKVIYQRTGWPTDVESVQNSEISVQKRIVNGQLMIEKNGVLYNAQGQVVK